MFVKRPLFTPIIEKTVAVVSMAMTTSAQDVVGLDIVINHYQVQPAEQS